MSVKVCIGVFLLIELFWECVEICFEVVFGGDFVFGGFGINVMLYMIMCKLWYG